MLHYGPTTIITVAVAVTVVFGKQVDASRCAKLVMLAIMLVAAVTGLLIGTTAAIEQIVIAQNMTGNMTSNMTDSAGNSTGTGSISGLADL